MLNCCLKQENSCIIVYTENLGDTTIALAHFLFHRKDIQIYCITISIYCNI